MSPTDDQQELWLPAAERGLPGMHREWTQEQIADSIRRSKEPGPEDDIAGLEARIADLRRTGEAGDDR